jgi:plasmid stability protein
MLSKLRSRAACNHRSLNGEILAIIDIMLSGNVPAWATSSVHDDPVERQKAAILNSAGGWVDTRSEKEIIADIESHRTKGRKVEL